jgi:hypothetical protein
MMCVIKTMSEDDFMWALCGGNAISNREVVQPHDDKKEEGGRPFAKEVCCKVGYK